MQKQSMTRKEEFWNFEKEYWEENLRHPDWYLKLERDLSERVFPIIHQNPSIKEFRHKIYGLVKEMLERGEIPLAESGPNFDQERELVSTVVIHHTEEDPNISLGRLSAIGFVRQYGLKYLQDDVLDYHLRGQPIWSNHFRNGRMVFFAYHWLVRVDGTTERLLEDTYIGMHSGVWDLNKKSVGIALSGDYETSTPPKEQIEGAARLIREVYPQVVRDQIAGHREVKEGRTCPGSEFVSGWKETLLRSV